MRSISARWDNLLPPIKKSCTVPPGMKVLSSVGTPDAIPRLLPLVLVESAGDDQSVVEQGSKYGPDLRRGEFQRVAEMTSRLPVCLASEQFENAQAVPCKSRRLASHAPAL